MVADHRRPGQGEPDGGRPQVAGKTRVEHLHDPGVTGSHGGDADDVLQQLPERHGVRGDARGGVPGVLELDRSARRCVDHQVDLASPQVRAEELRGEPARCHAQAVQRQHRLVAHHVLGEQVPATGGTLGGEPVADGLPHLYPALVREDHLSIVPHRTDRRARAGRAGSPRSAGHVSGDRPGSPPLLPATPNNFTESSNTVTPC